MAIVRCKWNFPEKGSGNGKGKDARTDKDNDGHEGCPW